MGLSGRKALKKNLSTIIKEYETTYLNKYYKKKIKLLNLVKIIKSKFEKKQKCRITKKLTSWEHDDKKPNWCC